jgi:neurofibromin 1
VDLCKAATYVPPTEESVLRHITADIEDELQEELWKITITNTNDNTTNTTSYDLQTLLTEYLLTRLQLNSDMALTSVLGSYFGEDAPLFAKQALMKACLLFAQNHCHLPWNADLTTVYSRLFPYLAKLLVGNVTMEYQPRTITMQELTTTSQRQQFRNTQSRSPDSTTLSLDLLRLFNIAPFVRLSVSGHEGQKKENGNIL